MNCEINYLDWRYLVMNFVIALCIAVGFGVYYYFRGIKDGRKEIEEELKQMEKKK